MHILLTGATGTIGRPLCAALRGAGATLTVLSRRRADEVRRLCGPDVRVWSSLQSWTPDIAFDAVINLAGEPIADARWTEARQRVLWASRIELTEELVARMGAAARRPAVLLSGSAIGVYGDTGERLLDEDSPAGQDYPARLCSAWEARALAAQALGVRVALLRTGLVLAPHGGLLARLRPTFSLGLGARLGHGRQYMSWIHVDDQVALMQWLLDHDQARGAFNLTAPEPVTNAEFTAALGRALRRPALLAAPSWALQLGLGEMSQLLTGGQRVLPARAHALGYRFLYPRLDLALRAALG